MLKSLTTRTSPFLWTPVKLVPPPLLVVPGLGHVAGGVTGPQIGFWKNQKPFCASPLLSNRSIPKTITLQVPVAGFVPLGQVPEGAVAGRLYRAAKPFKRMSLPGRPPLAWFQAQLEMSMGSLEPPPVNVVPVLAPCEAHSTAAAPVVLEVVEQSVPRTWWQTRSQSSGAP